MDVFLGFFCFFFLFNYIVTAVFSLMPTWIVIFFSLRNAPSSFCVHRKLKVTSPGKQASDWQKVLLLGEVGIYFSEHDDKLNPMIFFTVPQTSQESQSQSVSVLCDITPLRLDKRGDSRKDVLITKPREVHQEVDLTDFTALPTTVIILYMYNLFHTFWIEFY